MGFHFFLQRLKLTVPGEEGGLFFFGQRGGEGGGQPEAVTGLEISFVLCSGHDDLNGIVAL